MQPDLLQQLRDIHLPPDPGWWPPAPGWWLLAVLAAAGLLVTAHQLILRWRRRRPIRVAQRLYRDLLARYRHGDMPVQSFVNQSNELLKRLLIHGLHIDSARPAVNEAWLGLLDRCYGRPAFTEGPGRILGVDRFRPKPPEDVEALTALLERFFREVRP